MDTPAVVLVCKMMDVTPFLQFALALVIPGIDLDGQMTDRARACRQRGDQCERAAAEINDERRRFKINSPPPL